MSVFLLSVSYIQCTILCWLYPFAFTLASWIHLFNGFLAVFHSNNTQTIHHPNSAVWFIISHDNIYQQCNANWFSATKHSLSPSLWRFDCKFFAFVVEILSKLKLSTYIVCKNIEMIANPDAKCENVNQFDEIHCSKCLSREIIFESNAYYFFSTDVDSE